jgi:hypothetical protein
MGAAFSKKTNSEQPQKFNNFYDMLDYIATYYILTMDFESLQKLSDPKYCDQLIVITSDIVSKYFNELDIEYLEQRTKEGLEINDMAKGKVMFLTKDHLENLDIKNDRNKSIRKKRVCIGIAKFYVTIANIYAAIITTVNPVYTYKDQTGQVIKKNWSDKNNIPKNAEVKNTNICDERIKSLSIGITNDENISEYDLKPNICSFNKDRETNVLSDEPGISELEKLYYDVYNYSNGTFDTMSAASKQQYQDDLKSFYYAFTGNNDIPPEITKFGDIPLRNFSNTEGCLTGKNKPKHVSKNDKLFMAYANHIKEMIQNASQKQQELTGVLNMLFLPVVDPYTKEKKIRIHPKLTDAILKKAVKKTRDIIVKLYSKCEEDYLEGVLLYEAVIETKIKDTLDNQITNLDSDKQQIIDGFKQNNIILNPVPSPNISSNYNPNVINNFQNENPDTKDLGLGLNSEPTMLEPLTNPVITPITNENPILEPKPIITPIITPITNQSQILEPNMNPILEPLTNQNPILEPNMNPILEPLTNQSQILEPNMNPILEPLTNQSQILEPNTLTNQTPKINQNSLTNQ